MTKMEAFYFAGKSEPTSRLVETKKLYVENKH